MTGYSAGAYPTRFSPDQILYALIIFSIQTDTLLYIPKPIADLEHAVNSAD